MSFPAVQFAPDAVPLRPAFPVAWRGTLDALRVIAAESRVAPRVDLFRACQLLTDTPDGHARALIRCLGQALTRRPVFHRPNTHAVSFDEAWLLRAIIAAHVGDTDSLAFLVRSRVGAMHQRQIRFLIAGTARTLPTV